MTPTLTLTRDNITPTLREFARVMRRDLPAVVKEAAKRTTREVLAITPPASAGATGRDAYNQGRSRIKSDLHRVFAPVRLKGRRIINMVFGRPIAQPITIKTVEKYPDVESVYKQNSKWRQNGVGFRSAKLKNKFYVDERKFKRLQEKKELAVGRMASGWSSGAQSLGLAVPAWIRRHGNATGYVQSQLSGPVFRITIGNFAPGTPPNVRAELARRIPYAMRYAVAGMQRNIDFVTMKSARSAGIKTLRTPVGGSIMDI